MTILTTTSAPAAAGATGTVAPAGDDAPRVAPAGVGGPATPRRGVHIPALDGLRGLAIVLVLLFHFNIADSSHGALRRSFVYLLGAGWSGVDLFFVLSGFLITTILYEAKHTEGYFRNFYMRRVLRIFPLYYAVLIVMLLVVPMFHDAYRQNAWALWVYLANYFPPHGTYLDHFWSLAVEEQFYLVWPAVVFLLPRRWLMGVCGLMMLAGLCFRILRVTDAPPGGGIGYATLTYYAAHCRMDSLAVGALIALAAQGAGGIARLGGIAKWVMALAGAGLLAIYVRNKLMFPYFHPLVQTAGYSLLGLFFGALLVRTVLAPPTSLLGRVFNGNFLRFFGKYSYGIYVFHGILFPFLTLRTLGGEMPANPLVFYSLLAGRVVVGTGISVLLALVSWHLFEKHFLKLKRFFEYKARTLTEPVNDGLAPPSAGATGPVLVKGA